MNTAELGKFLEPGRIAVVATLRRDGFPHLVPVWYLFDGESILIWTDKTRAWPKNVMRDGRVALSVQDDRPPFAALVLRGRAEVFDQADDAGYQMAKDISARYIGEDAADDYVKPWWPKLHTFVRITPDKITSWDRGY
ncbi:MAG: PPOX class F420-dependent oxidoreductase [SAR202 cluster bacterium]|jgi:PPOX class probable F420-dependent enzyme|nr:PPOX class F420-dependent oxidoreductase [SAR202 cluster bacterium]MDP6716095.1 PPOX class F420-dependent oxidoreductase [SAR202 cluster bacterium]